MDIRNFFAKKKASGGDSTRTTGGVTQPPPKTKTKTTTTTTATTTTTSATTTTKRKIIPPPKKKEEEKEKTVVITGFESLDEDDYIPPSPKKKLKQASSPPPKVIISPPQTTKRSPARQNTNNVNNNNKSSSSTASGIGGSPTPRVPMEKTSPSKTATATTTITKTTTPVTKKPPAAKQSPVRAKSATKTPQQPSTPLLDATERDGYDLKTDNIVPECLQGLTFCMTGIFEELNRLEITDLLKSLGGRVTGGVSGKTSYLIVGPFLEDGRPAHTSQKYRDAQEKGTKIITTIKQLYGLCHQYQDRAMKLAGITKDRAMTTTPTTASPQGPPSVPSTPAAAAAAAVETPSKVAVLPPKVNPYAKTSMANPYANKASTSRTAPPVPSTPTTTTTTAAASATTSTNPYAKKNANPYSRGGTTSTGVSAVTSSSSHSPSNDMIPGQLWVDRHAPKNTHDILGNADNVNKLRGWLNSWERTFNKPEAYGKTFSAPKGPWKAALLSGPPGIGKTTTATLVVKEAGRDLREFNASDARSKKALQQQLGDLTGSQSLGFAVEGTKQQGGTSNKNNSQKQLRCVIMDEVDGMGAGDRGGTQELIQMIKKSKVPIICICNDRQAQSIKSLVPYCMDLRFKRPNKSVMANRAIRVAEMEGLHVERNAAEAIAESCGNDVRQILNVLQMWAQRKGSREEGLSYQTLKERESSINKDEILRVGLFDAAKSIMEGRKGLSGCDMKVQVDSFFKRSDAFFVDYSFTGLLVQQNYTKIMDGPWGIVKKADNDTAESKFFDRVHDAALSMSDYAVFDHGIRGNGDQNWGLLPAAGMMTVKTGYHAGGKNGGFLPGYPEFTAWLGKNSSRGKKQRILSELHYHINYKISGDSQQLRESYLPVFRERFMEYFQGTDRSEEANDAAIALMDDYGLSREDVMEKLDEFKMFKDQKSFADIDSKQKAAFTRRWNQGSHRSQALVAEEMGLNKPKKNKSRRTKDPADLDAIDEDGDMDESESESEDEEKELKKLAEKLGKTRSRSTKTTTTSQAKPSKRPRKSK